MAYAQFSEIGGASVLRHTYAPAPAVIADPVGVDRLTALEWTVVSLARRDREASLRPAGRWTNAWRGVMRQGNPRLADDRLEALRRIAVLSWRYGYAVPSHEVTDFIAAGFSAGQYETVVDAIDATKVRRGTNPY